MSHHTHMLPGIVPIDRPLPSLKKRRTRKLRAAGVGQAGGIDALAGDDEEFYFLADGPDDPSAEAEQRPAYASARFSCETMKTLLAVQEGL